MTALAGLRDDIARMPWPTKLIALSLLATLAALSMQLWPVWSQNLDLSHGRFVPLIFLVLVFESRQIGTQRFIHPNKLTHLLSCCLALAAVLVLCASGLWAAVLEWSHDLVLFSLTVSVSLLLGTALIAFADERVRLLPLNWTSLTAILLWPLSAPIPPGTYTRISVGLQLWISGSVVKALNTFGIAAHQTGNIIELTRTSLGVNEACSGVRSLLSCLFAGVFLSATLVRRTRDRVGIIVLAPLLALGMNFIRSLGLALLANSGVNIAAFWHDTAGLVIIAATTLLLVLLALWMEKGTVKKSLTAAPSLALSPRLPLSQGIVAGALALLVSLIVFFYVNSHPLVQKDRPAPDLMSLLPEAPSGWRVVASEDLANYRDVLLTDNLAQRIYMRGEGFNVTYVTIYLAYWKPGQASVSHVASHTPDACWPGTGWVAQPTMEPHTPLRIAGKELTGSEARCFSNSGYRQFVWFWHLHDGHPIPFRDPYSFIALLKIAWQYGFHHHGDQLFIRVSSNRPWSEIVDEPVLRQFFGKMKPWEP